MTFTGFVADEDLRTLISAATLLAMPSKYEGFGLPVLEAMACGTPVDRVECVEPAGSDRRGGAVCLAR